MGWMLGCARWKPGFGGHLSLLSCIPLKMSENSYPKMMPLSKGKHSSQVKINGAKGSSEATVFMFRSMPWFSDFF